MDDYFSSMFAEIAARRRRLRKSFGPNGQALAEFLLLGGLALGSAGLFLQPWMVDAAPWGLALPVVFLAGYALIEARRQAAERRGAEAEKVAVAYDWMALLWGLFCALAGAAAFVIAWTGEPPAPVQPEGWLPPANVVDSDIQVVPD